jgi:GDP-L-fucose synthase
MKILITGTNGYIGSSIYNSFKQKYDIVALTRQQLNLENSEQVNAYFLGKYFDVVIHCAIKGGSRLKEDTWSVMDSNLKMYYNLLQNKMCFGKLIQFGSGAECIQTDKPYGFSKRVISKSIMNQDFFYNLRIYAVFDEMELDTRFIKANVKRYIDKKNIQIHQNKYMSFFYMEDLIKMVDAYILRDDLPKQVDCCYEEAFTLKEIANIINTLDEHKVDINIHQEGLTEGYMGFNSTVKLDYVGLEKGIVKTYNKLKCNQ